MKHLLLFAALFASVTTGTALVSASAKAAEYSIDPSHSHAGFTIRHLVGKVSGEFKDISGNFTFDPAKPEAFSGKITIKADSINTNNEKRDAHLRTPDFFDTAKFATLTFDPTKMSANGDKKYKLEGKLTMHGVTKPIVFDVEYLGSDKDPWGNMRAGFSTTAKLNRRDFGVTGGKAGTMLGDDIAISVDIEATIKQ